MTDLSGSVPKLCSETKFPTFGSTVPDENAFFASGSVGCSVKPAEIVPELAACVTAALEVKAETADEVISVPPQSRAMQAALELRTIRNFISAVTHS